MQTSPDLGVEGCRGSGVSGLRGVRSFFRVLEGWFRGLWGRSAVRFWVNS